jgi:hypothetical protein
MIGEQDIKIKNIGNMVISCLWSLGQMIRKIELCDMYEEIKEF